MGAGLIQTRGTWHFKGELSCSSLWGFPETQGLRALTPRGKPKGSPPGPHRAGDTSRQTDRRGHPESSGWRTQTHTQPALGAGKQGRGGWETAPNSEWEGLKTKVKRPQKACVWPGSPRRALAGSPTSPGAYSLWSSPAAQAAPAGRRHSVSPAPGLSLPLPFIPPRGPGARSVLGKTSCLPSRETPSVWRRDGPPGSLGEYYPRWLPAGDPVSTAVSSSGLLLDPWRLRFKTAVLKPHFILRCVSERSPNSTGLALSEAARRK